MTPPVRPERSLLDLIDQQRPMARDATATPGYRPRPVPTMRAAGPRPAGSARGSSTMDTFLDAIAAAFQPSEDTALGMVNEMVNPLRAGVQARELTDKAVHQARRGNVGAALGSAALAAMAVPGVPGGRAAKAVDEAGDVGRAVERAFVPPREPIITYHGTPHTFAPEPGHPLGRFRLDKMGTGEGLQGFGYGINLADTEEFADQYRNIQGPFSVDGTGWWHARANIGQFSAPEQAAFDLMNMADGDIDEAARIATQYPKYATAYADAKRMADAGRITKSGVGNVYETEILASPDNLLDRDLPLAEQPPTVRAAIQRLGLNEANAVPDNPEAAARLREAGIPGLRYESGEGTRNYVIWDESKLRILRALAAMGMVSGAALAKAEQEAAAQQRGTPDA